MTPRPVYRLAVFAVGAAVSTGIYRQATALEALILTVAAALVASALVIGMILETPDPPKPPCTFIRSAHERQTHGSFHR